MKGSTSKKRKRSEIDGVKEFEQHLKQNKNDFMNSVKTLKTERDDLAQKCELLKTAEQTLKELRRDGFLDEHGLPIKKK